MPEPAIATDAYRLFPSPRKLAGLLLRLRLRLRPPPAVRVQAVQQLGFPCARECHAGQRLRVRKN